MADSKSVAIEVFVVVAILNAFLGVGQEIYSEGFPGESIRSPFTKEPIGENIDGPVSSLDLPTLQDDLINPTDEDGNILDWVAGNFANFGAVVEVITTFIKFLVGGYVVDMLVGGLGFPGNFAYIFTVPLTIYTIHLLVSLLTNRST